MRGYADRELPAKPVSRMVAYVAGPGSLASGPAVRMIKFTEMRRVGALEYWLLSHRT